MLIPLMTVLAVALFLLAVVGPIFKLLGIIDWEWKVIFAPIWITLLVVIVFVVGWGLFIGFLGGLLLLIAK